ncbi:hypothetical protein CDD81_5860 [Ophiocordyceps australis]|uniref:Uncharacterized protein n=1 Tax=Ophiocordyceps australis TaxID=1399860 RepID=A0A2C5XM03_9HYPO|nr:hypothetical protein CDD81_5860 [Ophiocordyceps australis]
MTRRCAQASLTRLVTHSRHISTPARPLRRDKETKCTRDGPLGLGSGFRVGSMAERAARSRSAQALGEDVEAKDVVEGGRGLEAGSVAISGKASRAKPRPGVAQVSKATSETQSGKVSQAASGHGADKASTRTKADAAPNSTVQDEPPDTNDRTYVLVIHGLSPNVGPSDFYRLDANVAAGQESSIIKVRQQRNPLTLEPSGRFHIVFGSALAASTYRQRLLHLHYMARYRFRSPTGLAISPLHPWRLLADLSPASIRALSASDQASDPVEADFGAAAEATVQSYALMPASLPTLATDRPRLRASIAPKWASRLDAIVAKRGISQKPSTILLHVYPPTLSVKDLWRFILHDGSGPAGKWHVGVPHHLKPEEDASSKEALFASQEEDHENVADMQGTELLADMQGTELLRADDDETDAHVAVDTDSDDGTSPFQEWRKNPFYSDFTTPEKQWCRFIVPCATEPEARRFHRYWNQRILVSGRGEHVSKNVVHASIVKW